MKVTQWFQFTRKPVRAGVYEVQSKWGNVHYSRWHKGRWRYTCGSPADACKKHLASPSIADGCYTGWRGLADKPKS